MRQTTWNKLRSFVECWHPFATANGSAIVALLAMPQGPLKKRSTNYKNTRKGLLFHFDLAAAMAVPFGQLVHPRPFFVVRQRIAKHVAQSGQSF